TLVVRNKGGWFPESESVMYLSGAPLHVLTMNALGRFREVMGDRIPITFAAGVDRQNFHQLLTMNLAPVTTCTDLLRTGGYQRMCGYLLDAEARMGKLGVGNINDMVVKAHGQGERGIELAVAELEASVVAAGGPLDAGTATGLARVAGA